MSRTRSEGGVHVSQWPAWPWMIWVASRRKSFHCFGIHYWIVDLNKLVNQPGRQCLCDESSHLQFVCH